MDIPENWERILSDYAELERENARLRDLLNDIHRGTAAPPVSPKPYDSATVEGPKPDAH